MSLSNQFPWNIRIDVGGVSFEGPGAESRREAMSLKRIVEDEDGVQKAEVFQQ